MQYLALVIGQGARGDDLEVAKRRAIVQLDEAEAALGVAPRPHPALHEDVLADRLRLPRLHHADLFHDCLPEEEQPRNTRNTRKRTEEKRGRKERQATACVDSFLPFVILLPLPSFFRVFRVFRGCSPLLLSRISCGLLLS